jgi:heme o synthase
MMWSRESVRAYYRLTKPGIVYGNGLMAIAGYFFGAAGNPSLAVFLSMLLGISAVIASACAYNNIIDRDIDAKMERTKARAIPSGQISKLDAVLFASFLLLIGLVLLVLGTNVLTALVALAGHFAYVVLYGYAKRKTVHGTLVGTLSGSTPPVIGYIAATGALDVTALLLFLVLAAWQMPHFYAIAIFRRDDYKRANIPVLSVVSGMEATRRQIVIYVGAFIITCVLLGLFSSLSLLSTLILVLLGAYWLLLCLTPIAADESIEQWARRQFGWSLKLLLFMCIILSLDSFLH